jgi:hypothetical protein
VEPAELIEEAVGAALRGGRSHPQDLEAGTILSLFPQVFLYYLVCNIGFYVAEEKYWGRTPLHGCFASCA